MSGNVDLSVVAPVFNEEGNLEELHRRLTAILDGEGLAYEIVLVDDGSTDASLARMEALAERDPRVKIISFSRNFGHMQALCAGLDHARGKAVITLDADLQHPPELISTLVAKWREGAEIVGTIREETADGGFLKEVTSRFFYWLMRRIARINLPRSAADYRLLDRRVVDTLTGMRERSRFLRGLIGWVGYRQTFIPYRADPRFSGRTKYSLSRMVAFAIDGITSFSALPLRLATYVGLFIALLGVVDAVYVLWVKLFTDRTIAGWAYVMLAVLFIGGVQLVFLGVLGEYLSRVYDETKQRPLYVVRKKIGL
jgi:glycosyltransferase involved in cell wall biosynthesis